MFIEFPALTNQIQGGRRYLHISHHCKILFSRKLSLEGVPCLLPLQGRRPNSSRTHFLLWLLALGYNLQALPYIPFTFVSLCHLLTWVN